MAKASYGIELDEFNKYLRSESSEDARRPHLYPLFKKLYKEKFKIESDAKGADVYVEGQLIVEAKSDDSQWLEGFYQALHYSKKYGLVYSTIMVVARQFVAIWKVNKLPEFAVIISHRSDANIAPSEMGKINAKKTAKISAQEIRNAAFYWLDKKDLAGDIFAGARNLITESYEILKILLNLESDRVQINTHNFINVIESLKPFFTDPIDAIHAFYTIVAYWDITSTVSINESGDEIRLVGFKGSRLSEPVAELHPRNFNEFKKFVESRYVFTNEGSGLTVDFYFSRFDEVISKINPEYAKQHGIFFTDDNLSKFALWFVEKYFHPEVSQNYIVFDPAGGSGNLVSSWRGKLKHKIVSELQPDLLKTIERRMKVDPFHVETGFTIIPKTTENKGLNFLDISAAEYLNELKSELSKKNLQIDKPIAFLLNPPYKNTDENEGARIDTDAEYKIHDSILDLTGADAGKERYLAFLGQILNIAKVQNSENETLLPIVMIFTPTSWLIPRPTYAKFRKIWDESFEYKAGFIITSNEFFAIDGKWPLAFTIWQFKSDNKLNNDIKVFDFTELKNHSLNINWNNVKELDQTLNSILTNAKNITLDNSRGDIRNYYPFIETKLNPHRQTRYDFSSAKKDYELNKLVSGFPKLDLENHFKLNRKCGVVDGEFIGFMDNCIPVRLKQDPSKRMSSKPDRVWFRLDTDFKGTNRTKVFNGAPDNRGYCAMDLSTSKLLFSWYSITKALNGRYPVWANQFEIWPPNINKNKERTWYTMCFAFVLAENRCVITKFEKDNPVAGAPEVFVDNPLCPANPESFWSMTLEPYINLGKPSPAAENLINEIKLLYKTWNLNYCKGQFLTNVGLHNEPYFKYFDYADFLTPYSGLIQIKKYAEQEGLKDLVGHFEKINAFTKTVKEELYMMLVVEFRYFE